MSVNHPDAQLYGLPRPKHEPKTTIKASTSHSFAAALSSLISTPKTSTNNAKGRTAGNRKDDIFTTHNRGAKKRAAADDAIDQEYTSATGLKHRKDTGGVDHDTLHRSKRKMEEKARLYSAMKRGDYVLPSRGGINAEESGSLVDFDRKWAESHAASNEEDEDEEASSDNATDSDQEMVEYVDEFGRTRTGTRQEAEKEKRRQRIAVHAEMELAEMSARPSMPEGIMLGDAIQSAAFNPDHAVETAMADLASKRDRSVTPPEDTHYDATKEVRSKGVGFYQFSKDKDARQEEFAHLEREREETLHREQERNDRKQKKLEELEERKRKLREKRSQKQADGFLKSLDGDLAIKDPND